MPSREALIAQKELERRNLPDGEVRLLNAKFYLQPGLTEEQVQEAVLKNTRKYMEVLVRDRWTVLDTPVVRKVRVVEEAGISNSNLYLPSAQGVWHPDMLHEDNTIPVGHDYLREGMDLYMIWVIAEHEAESGVMEIDDDVLQEMIDTDSVPEGLVIH